MMKFKTKSGWMWISYAALKVFSLLKWLSISTVIQLQRHSSLVLCDLNSNPSTYFINSVPKMMPLTVTSLTDIPCSCLQQWLWLFFPAQKTFILFPFIKFLFHAHSVVSPLEASLKLSIKISCSPTHASENTYVKLKVNKHNYNSVKPGALHKCLWCVRGSRPHTLWMHCYWHSAQHSELSGASI